MNRTNRRLVLIAAIAYFLLVPFIAWAIALVAVYLLGAQWASDVPVLAWVAFAMSWLLAVLAASAALMRGRDALGRYREARRETRRSGGVR